MDVSTVSTGGRSAGGKRRSALLGRALLSGSAASAASALVLLARSRAEAGSAAAGINAPSHWVHGEPAIRQRRWTGAHSALGSAIHHLSSVFWAMAFEALLARRPRTPATLAAAGISGVAALTDLKLVPYRLTPGFQRHLRPASLALVYLAFGAGLAAAALCRPSRHS